MLVEKNGDDLPYLFLHYLSVLIFLTINPHIPFSRVSEYIAKNKSPSDILAALNIIFVDN